MDDLDRRIKSWGARVPSGAPGEPFYQRILASLRSRVAPNAQAQVYAYRRQLLFTRAALACALLLAIISLPAQTRVILPAPGPGPVAAGPRTGLVLAAGELRELREVAAAIDATFPEGVRWIQSAAGAQDIKTGQPAAVGAGAQRMLISIHIVRMNPDGTETVTRQDLIARDGEPMTWNGDRQGALWTHQVSDQYVNVDLDGRFGDDQVVIEIKDRLLQPFGEPTLIGKASSQERRYEVYQTVYQL